MANSADGVYTTRECLESVEQDARESELLDMKADKLSEQENPIAEDFDISDIPLSENITCGFWIFRSTFLQRFANQTSYVLIYGFVGFSMTSSYFNGTISTMEKRFKIPSKNMGIITVGYDISILAIVSYCLLTAMPHFLFGPGEDALAFTTEFGAVPDENATKEAFEKQRAKMLCQLDGGGTECETFEGNLGTQILLFTAQFISRIGGTVYGTLGISYMDDNTEKSKTPALLSVAYFIRMLGPAVGYALASVCLRLFVAPQLHPVINDDDPRWLGAWWLGWLIIGALLLFSGVFLAMFPKELPQAVVRRASEKERRKKYLSIKLKDEDEKKKVESEFENATYIAEHEDGEHGEKGYASFKDLLNTYKRLIANKILTCNNLSSIFYFFGYAPYWIFTPKYIEIQYRQSASTSNMVTGTIALAFSALGVLIAGFVISRYKPSARYMAAWNVIVGFLTVAGILSYAFIDCPDNESSVIVNIYDSAHNSSVTCNSACSCAYVPYSPVCGENNVTYISACHAGCIREHTGLEGKKTFHDCSCIPKSNISYINKDIRGDELSTLFHPELLSGGQALSGSCPINCWTQFVTFLAVMCCIKFIGAAGRASNFLVSVRCVSEEDKTASMGLSMMVCCMFAFIPSPIFFGWVLDQFCLVWGKTCTSKGNCWLYDPAALRYTLNFIAAAFITIGSIFDCGVWYYVKDLKIFDDDIKEIELQPMMIHSKDKDFESAPTVCCNHPFIDIQ